MPPPTGRPRRVAIAVRTWASEESVFVWAWARKYFIQTGRERDWLYIVHVCTQRDRGRADWKAGGPFIPELDRALQGYSYDIIELSGETAAWALTSWVKAEEIDVLVVSAGKGKKRNPLNPLSSNTTDYIASHAACATLVIHPKISLADLTRVHLQQQEAAAAAAAAGRGDAVDAAISNRRRVAFADESSEGLSLLTAWAALHCSRPDDLEFLLLVNRKSMLARVTQSIRHAAPPRRRAAASVSAVDGTLASAAAALASAGSAGAAPLPVVTGDTSDLGPPPHAPHPPEVAAAAAAAAVTAGSTGSSAGAGGGTLAPGRSELIGKPSSVIRSFVSENNIDLLIVPVAAPPSLKRVEMQRSGKLKQATSVSVYHKLQCTCLCVPAHLLLQPDGSAISSGLIFSEDDFDDDEPVTVTTGAPGALGLSVSPPTGQEAVAAGPFRRQQSPARHTSLPAHVSSSRSAPLAPTLSAAAAETSLPFVSPAGNRGHLSSSTAPNTPAHAAMAAVSASAVSPPATGPPSYPVHDTDSGAGGSQGSSERKLFSSLRNRLGQLRAGNSSGKRDQDAPSSPGGASGRLLGAPEAMVVQQCGAEHEALQASLMELQAVLAEGGLSAEMRARGADAVSAARAAIAAAASDAAIWRGRAEEAEAKLAAGVAALCGSSPTRVTPVGSDNLMTALDDAGGSSG